MARWDEILSLPVQNPPTPEFSAADIVWSRVEGWRETMDKLALIPFMRVNDFLRGESNNKECPTRFHIEARRKRPRGTAYKPKVDGVIEYILYWCSFGPDDHRKGGSVRPSRTYSVKRKTPAGRPNTKRGCVCHFIMKRLIADPNVALIIYNKDKHVDKKGLPCHGPQDKKAAGTRAMFAPYISDELRLQLTSLLYVGVPVETIMQRHTEMVRKQGGPSNRDDLLSHRYVRRLERNIRRSTYELDPDDAVSLGLWVENHQNHVFLFEDFSESEPFVLGIQTEWQLQQMICFGNRGLLACDSKLGSNKLKYPVYSLLVFDANNNAMPVAWIITPSFASGEIHRWLSPLYARIRSKDPTWRLGGFIIDDPSADVLSIREVFKCSVLISFWRVRHAWHKKLMEKCPDIDIRVEMSRRLGEAVSIISRGTGDIKLFDAFMEDFVDCSDFLDYFMAIWFHKIGSWITALKALPLASTEVSAAIECYHHQLRLRLLNEKDTLIYHRVDWLVDKLGTKVHSYYWLDEYSEKDNFARYWKDEWKSHLTSWRQASQILDSDVVLNDNIAKVVSGRSREKVHTVLNPGSEFSMCDCGWSKMGNICKHMIKTTRFCRDRGSATPSNSLFDYNRILRSILHCPPHDSLIRDHAIALAVSVQAQLNALFGSQNSSSANIPVDPCASATENVENAEKGLTNEDRLASEKNKNHSSTQEYDTLKHPEVPSTGLPPIKHHFACRNDIASYGMKNEEECFLSQSLSLGSTTCNSSRIGDGSLDDMVIDSCSVLENSVTEKMITIDPHSFISTSMSEVVTDAGEENFTLKISDVLIDKDKGSESMEADPYESMVDLVEVSNSISQETEKHLIAANICNMAIESSKASEDFTNSDQGSSNISDGMKTNGEIVSSMMEIEIYTDSVEEANTGHSSGEERGSVGLAIDVALGVDGRVILDTIQTRE